MTPLTLAFSALSPAGASAKLNIFIFHRVLPEVDPLFPGEVDARRFAIMLDWLKAWFEVLPLDAAVRRLADGSLPSRAAAITFDDGYADNYTVAMPLLQRAGMSATFFIATGFLDGGRMWNDTLIEAVRHSPRERLNLRELAPCYADLPELPLGSWAERRMAVDALINRSKYLAPSDRLTLVEAVARESGAAGLSDTLMLSSTQLRALHAGGMGIGAHTVNHPILARLSDGEARQEMAQSKASLESLLGERVGLFAYPNGKPGTDYSPASVELARGCGFDAAVSTTQAIASRGSDPFQLPRFTPWGQTRSRFGLKLLQNMWRG